MLIYFNITDGQADRQTYQKYSSKSHNIKSNFFLLLLTLHVSILRSFKSGY
jgi:hypothetical protein